MASSVPRKRASACSSRLCRSCVPQMKRTEDSPKPCVRSASAAASITAGSLDSPR